ncbi:4'-phosphopantetheinyl transferase superfamily protein [Salmonella enterica subsp. enterica serovar Concord]|nr:4'-phosphopantetheinyl transferase superfamily protein [Salmonella enterica subsp. enterica serovar Concord]
MRFFWHDILQITKEIPPFLRLAVLSFTGPANSHEEFIRYNIPFPPGLMRASEQRQAEYLAGRLCARRLLQEFDTRLNAPLMAADRSPCWPSHYQGSISHDGQLAISVVTRAIYGRVGADIESLTPKINPVTIKNLIGNTEEINRTISKGCMTEHQALILLFSAKESAYKALPHSLQQQADFLNLELNVINATSYLMTLRLRSTYSRVNPPEFILHGWYYYFQDRILTIVHMR